MKDVQLFWLLLLPDFGHPLVACPDADQKNPPPNPSRIICVDYLKQLETASDDS